MSIKEYKFNGIVGVVFEVEQEQSELAIIEPLQQEMAIQVEKRLLHILERRRRTHSSAHSSRLKGSGVDLPRLDKRLHVPLDAGSELLVGPSS